MSPEQGHLGQPGVTVQPVIETCAKTNKFWQQPNLSCPGTVMVQVRSNALNTMMDAVVGMGGDTGASQEHRVELALAALAAASGGALHLSPSIHWNSANC